MGGASGNWKLRPSGKKKLAKIICHMSRVTCHMSHKQSKFIYIIIFNIFFPPDKVVKLVGGRSVIYKATPSSFYSLSHLQFSFQIFCSCGSVCLRLFPSSMIEVTELDCLPYPGHWPSSQSLWSHQLYYIAAHTI